MQQVKFTLRTNVGITISLKISLFSRIRTVFGFLSWGDFGNCIERRGLIGYIMVVIMMGLL